MPKDLIPFTPETFFLDYKPFYASSQIREELNEMGSDALIIGDSHGSEYGLIQTLIVNEVIRFQPADLDILSRLAQTTYIEQLRVTNAAVDEIQHLSDNQIVALEQAKEELENALNNQAKAEKNYEIACANYKAAEAITDELYKLPSEQKKEAARAHYMSCKRAERESLKILENAKKNRENLPLEIEQFSQNLSYWQHLKEQKAKLYHQLVFQIKKEILDFRMLLKKMELLDLQKLILLIGDELSDRGNGDWKMLLLLSELKKRGVDIRSLLSNHGFEFLVSHYLNYWEEDSPFFLLGSDEDPTCPQGRSLVNLRTLIAADLFSEEELHALSESWIDSLNLVTSSYSEEENSVTLYTHAPAGLETIKNLAEKYNMPYCDTTARDLHNTIMAVNQRFKESLKNNPLESIQLLAEKYDIDFQDETMGHLLMTINRLEENINKFSEEDKAMMANIRKSFLYQLLEEYKGAFNARGQMDIAPCRKKTPLLALMWNRDRSGLESQEEHPNGFKCYFVNGHDTPKNNEITQNRFEIDGLWAKPTLPVNALYQYDPCQVKLKRLKDENNQTIISYHCSSEKGKILNDNNTQSAIKKLPKHYFSGVICVGNFHDPKIEKERPKIIQNMIQEQMNNSAVPTTLYSECYQEMRYLAVNNESFSPIITNVQQHLLPIASPSSIAAPLSPPMIPAANDDSENENTFYSKNYSGFIFSTPRSLTSAIQSDIKDVDILNLNASNMSTSFNTQVLQNLNNYMI